MIVYYDKGALEYEDYKLKICPDLGDVGYDIVAFGYFNGIYKGMPIKRFKTRQDANITLGKINQVFRRGDEAFNLRFNHCW